MWCTVRLATHIEVVTRSLIIAPQWIGDAVMTEPLLRALSARGERLTVIAVPWVAPVYRAMQHIEGLETTVDAPFQHGGLQWQARRDLAARIKSGEWGKFDKAYVLPNSFKSALLPWLANIPERRGYKGEMRFGLLNKRLANPPRHARGSMVEFYLNLAPSPLEGEGWGEGAVTPRPKLQANPNHSPKGSDPNWLADTKPKTYTTIAPGAEYGPAKRWPAAHFAELIAKLDNPVVLLGAAKEQALCEAIRQAALQASPTQTILNLAGKTNLTEAIALIANAKNMVSNDSGLMHVAAAFGIPQVAIFGSSDPRHTPPLNDKAKVLWLKEMDGEFKGLECSPCFKRECPLEGAAHLRCLKRIQPKAVHQVMSIGHGLLQFIEDARLGSRDIAIPVGLLKQPESELISTLSGRHVVHFVRTLEASAVRHTLKKHGHLSSEIQRGQIPVTTEDLAQFESLAASGSLEIGNKQHRGCPTIVTTSTDGRYHYTIVQAIRSRDVTLVTMHKRQAKKYLTGNT
jgi:heptosyltransferase-2